MKTKEENLLEILTFRKDVMKAFLAYEGKDNSDEIMELYKDEIITFLIYDKFPNKGNKREEKRAFLKEIPNKKYLKFEIDMLNRKLYEDYKKHEGVMVNNLNKQYLYRSFINVDKNKQNGWMEFINLYEYFTFCVVRTNIDKIQNITTTIGCFASQYTKAKLIEYLNVPTEMFNIIYKLHSKCGVEWDLSLEETISSINNQKLLTKRELDVFMRKTNEILNIKNAITNQTFTENNKYEQ